MGVATMWHANIGFVDHNVRITHCIVLLIALALVLVKMGKKITHTKTIMIILLVNAILILLQIIVI